MDVYTNIRFKWAFVVALLAAFASLSGATSRELQQEIGTDICYCAPNAYEFELDFSLTCPPVNITVGDAVAQTTCMVSPFGNEQVADLVPVRVTSIDVLELNQNLQVMVQETIQPTEAFLDKDTFSYVSYAAIPGEVVKPEDLPRAIQLNIVGVNQFEEEIINVYLITFTNSCGAYPVLYEGQWAGWTRFYDIRPPSPELCPAAATPAPTMDPTPFVMSMSMSMDLALDEFTIEDLLDGEYEYKPKSAKSKGKGKGGKKEKSKGGSKDGKSSKDKLTKPLGKDGKSKDGGKAGKSHKSKDGGKAGKSHKSKDGSKGGSKDGGKAGKSKDGSKAGKSEKSKEGKSSKDSTKTANKLTKAGQKVHKGKDSKSQKSKDGSKDGKTEKAKDGSKDGKSEKSKDGAKAGKSYKYEESGRKEAKSTKESDKLAKSKGKGGTRRQRLRI